jgi:hypothetical protein
VTQLRGLVTDLKSGMSAPVVLNRGEVAPMFSHCAVNRNPRQSSDGLVTIRVAVVDRTGIAVPGASVFVEKQGASAQDFDFRKDTQVDGIRQVTGTPGTYRLSVYKPGFGSEKRNDELVVANQILEARCELHPLER